MNLEQEEYEISLAEQFKRHAQDFNDLQNELAGNDVGRISRFLSGDERGLKGAEKRRAKWEQTLSNLQIMMQDPEYAQFYRETEGVLRDSQTKLDEALEQVQQAKVAAMADLEGILSQAARLPNDGARVFKDRNGQVRFEDGSLVGDELAATIEWTGAEPGSEQLEAAREHAERLTELETYIITGQAEIGDSQERMVDKHNPVSREEQQGFQDRAKEIVDDIDTQMKAVFEAPPSNPSQDVDLTIISQPDIPQFN